MPGKLLLLCLISFMGFSSSALAELRVLVIFAHPDEGEIYAGGTTALYTALGHKVKFLSITNGDAGHFSMCPEDLARRRHAEAMKAGETLGLVEYEVLNYHDGHLKDGQEVRHEIARRIEDWKADVVFSFYPAEGGHNDNMNAGWIVRGAAALLHMPNPPLFLYMRDYFTTRFSYIPDIAVRIDGVWETKLKACGAHESQVLEYNPNLEGVLGEVQASKERQRQFLFNNTYAFSRVTPDILLALEKWYGREVSREVRYVEAFDTAEFGRQVRESELRQLLPMPGYVATVPGNSRSFDTGLDIEEGEVVEIRAEGEIRWNTGSEESCGPAGAGRFVPSPNKPIPGVNTGALIGRVGADSADCFYIGPGQKIKVFRSGRLYVGINDDNMADNDGAFRVWIRLPR